MAPSVNGRVLVTDGEQRAALAITRSLGRAGYAVTVGANGLRSLAGASRHCVERVVLPDPLAAPSDHATRIVDVARQGSMDAVIPVTEASLLALLPVRGALGATRLPFPAEESFRRMSDKAALMSLANLQGLSTPRSLVLSTASEAGSLLGGRITFPLVVKPTRSLQERNGRRCKDGPRYVDRPEMLAATLAEVPEDAFPLLAQERIVGQGIGLFLLRWNGRILARFAHRRLREKPPSGGISVYCESVAADASLMERAEGLLAAEDWQGVAMIEFKRDIRDGLAYLMEVNGRFWGSLQLAIDAGVDFPAMLVSAALGRPASRVPDYRVGVRSRWLLGDLDHLVIRLRSSNSRLKLPAGAPGRLRTAADILLPWRSPGRGEIWRRDDPRPARVEMVDWLKHLV